jgi:hypothetical protein
LSTQDAIIEECREMLVHGIKLEEAIRFLRQRGLSKTHSIKALVDLGQVDLSDAKRIVHDSRTWADVRERDEEFQRKLE